jgi:signal transduction histidine kinase
MADDLIPQAGSATRPVARSGAEGERRRHARWWRLSLRARLTAVATGLVALGLVAGAVLLDVALQRALYIGLDDTARQRAADVAALVDADRLADPIPLAGGTAVVQVVDTQGRVRAASAGGDHLVPLLEPGPLAEARAGRPVFLDGARIAAADPLRVIAAPAGPADDPQTVLVAVSLAELENSLRVVQLALLLGAPVLLIALAVLSWIVVGSALRPVAALRQGAEEITGSGGSRRLPVPAADDEVRRLAVTLNDMLTRLESASARQRAFVADAAHELRSPLAAVRTQLEVAIHHPGSANWPETAADVLEDAARLSRLVDDLLLLARLDEGHRPPRPTRGGPTDLVPVVDAVLARPLPGERALVRTGDPSLSVDGESDQLTRIVANLVDNAVRHADRRVVVDLRADGDMAVLTVSDDGPGISPVERERMFERFARLDGARTRDDGGSGLGLAIVRGLVEAHGGSVQLADARPGLRAIVRLPAALHPT